ncbi:hypothetical protein QEJ31_13815 [Pigmentibacter sp. JX0631]|uniref:hypothetical protein n=1 Tax=Pigmentibacter sp. JX0631 TaxID=2976982 RepID=UPI0024685E96|nr:hypothetical protein [Pigmentibacter sp. JX0631]WGL59603.1 hypothetical protein QEJ31_13815 [Pigmentibacter sp. JX0631]
MNYFILFLTVFFFSNNIYAQSIIRDTFQYPIKYCQDYVLAIPNFTDQQKSNGIIIRNESFLSNSPYLKITPYLSKVNLGFFNLEPINQNLCKGEVHENEPFLIKFINTNNSEKNYLTFQNNSFQFAQKNTQNLQNFIFKFKELTNNNSDNYYSLYFNGEIGRKNFLYCDIIQGCYGKMEESFPIKLLPVVYATYEKAYYEFEDFL